MSSTCKSLENKFVAIQADMNAMLAQLARAAATGEWLPWVFGRKQLHSRRLLYRVSSQLFTKSPALYCRRLAVTLVDYAICDDPTRSDSYLG